MGLPTYIQQVIEDWRQIFEEKKVESTRKFTQERYNRLCVSGDDDWNDQVWDAVHRAVGVEPPEERPRNEIR